MKARCRQVFDHEEVDSAFVIQRSFADAAEFWNLSGLVEGGKISDKSLAGASSWCPPVGNDLKVNCDASFLPDSGATGLGVVVRDCNGAVVVGRSVRSIAFSVNVAEALALKEALKTALELNLRNFSIRIWPSIVHIKRNANKAADWFAKNASQRDALEAIAAIKPPASEEGKDYYAWIHNTNGDFSVKSAYTDVQPSEESSSGRVWKRCGLHAEIVLHTIRDCSRVSPLWKQLIKDRYKVAFFNSDLHEWVSINLRDEMGMERDFKWSSKFAITCWLLWRQRNEWVLNKQALASSLGPLIEIQVKELWEAKLLHGTKTDKLHTKMQRKGNAQLAEIWGIYFGLKTAWEKGFKKVVIELYSIKALRLIQGLEESCLTWRNLIQSTKYMLDKEWHVTFNYVFREGNCVADSLAHRASHHELSIYDICPSFCNLFIQNDLVGVSSHWNSS
ncbi:ribonuclease H [Senna tora]|uniref:Ribonuclease H n=1 Tax=Senna tora TaxID=362788 RepID=A0A834VYL0_9FABA|nr:ribonuclease H [Senna tora]